MSYIDCYSHSDAGQLFNFRVYHPLTKLDEEGYYIGSDNLLFGGGGVYGGGESKSFVFKDKLLCVMHYFKVALDFIDTGEALEGDALITFQNTVEQISKYIHEAEESYETNLIHNFSFSEIIKLHSNVENAPVVYLRKLQNLHDVVLSRLSVEHKLNIIAGEIFYYLAPHLFNKEESSIIEEVMRGMRSIGLHHPGRIYDVFSPAKTNWDCGGVIRYKDPATGEHKEKYGNICFFDEEQIFKGVEYQNMLKPINED